MVMDERLNFKLKVRMEKFDTNVKTLQKSLQVFFPLVPVVFTYYFNLPLVPVVFTYYINLSLVPVVYILYQPFFSSSRLHIISTFL